MIKHGEMQDPLRLLGKAAAGLHMDNLPTTVVACARQRIVDTIGCLVAGYNSGIADSIRAYVCAQGGASEATLLPGSEKTTTAMVGFAHAAYIHGLELSDVAPRGTVHPGNEIVPIALALAERSGCGGAKMIPAIVAGYEIEIRFGRALFPHAFYRGWWTPGMLGTIGAAVTAAHMLGLDAEGIDNAIGIALNLAPTAMEHANTEGSSVKWLIGGQACMTGLMAAEMAARGVKGLRDVAKGWLPVLSDEHHSERLTEGITEDGTFAQWEMLSGIVTKFYATVGPLAGPLDATFSLIKRHDIQIADVEVIEAECMRRAAIFNGRHPDNDIVARASLPYCLAVAVCTRDPAQLLGPAFRLELLGDKTVRDLEDRVRIKENEDYERQYPKRSLAKVTITLRNGASHSLEVDRAAPGRYLNPTDEDIEQKFNLIARASLGPANTDRVLAILRRIEELPNVTELIGCLQTKL